MEQIIDVNTGEVAVLSGEGILRAVAIGSCIVVAAYDSKAKIAGMVHIMLPGNAPEKSAEKTKYAADGIEQMLNQMLELNSHIDNIEVCLVGAGNVLQKEDDTICADNIKSATMILAKKLIPLRASVLGGYERKSIFFDVDNGTVYGTIGNATEKLLWKFKD